MREGAAWPSTPASELTRALMPLAPSTSASDWALGRSGSVVSRRQGESDIGSTVPAPGSFYNDANRDHRGFGLLHIRRLSRSFREGPRVHRVLEAAEATILDGQVVAITGRSGSGKSTLLNLISGIDAAESGSVSVDGIEVSSLA